MKYAHRDIATRIPTILIGVVSVSWAMITLPVFWQQSSIQRLSKLIIEGEQFKIEVLRAYIPVVEAAERSTFCNPSMLHAGAIVRLRVAEESLSRSDTNSNEEQLRALDRSVRLSLSCSPSDPFLWFILCWINCIAGPTEPSGFKELRMSYLSGPNEGWVGLRRVPFAFSAFDQLPQDVANYAVHDFIGLLAAGLQVQMREIFNGTSAAGRELILSRLGALSHPDREKLLRALRGPEYEFIKPAPQDMRPWRY